MIFEDDLITLTWGIRLDQAQEHKAIKILDQIRENQLLTNHSTNFPYIHLFEASVPSQYQSEIDEMFKKTVHLEDSFTTEWGEVEVTRNEIILWTEVNESLQKLQLIITSNVNNLNLGNPFASDLKPFVSLCKSSLPLDLNKIDIEWPFHNFHVREIFIANREDDKTLTIRHQSTLQESK